MKTSTVGTKGRDVGCVHGCVPDDIKPTPLLRQVRAVILQGGAQWWHSSQGKNEESICQEQELQLLIGPVPSDPLTCFLQREALEGLLRRRIMGQGQAGTWWSVTQAWASPNTKKMKASVWRGSSSQLMARKHECQIIIPCHMATTLGQV